MTEIIVESAVNETVIDIDDGPTLSTVITDEVQTIVSEFTDPIVIDLNSGPRGEPGAAILTGEYPPNPQTGVMGDMYIVTQGAELVGEVFRKTGPMQWDNEGNVRGPAGGVNVVNGYTGPDVTLTKADIGLGNVDNTPDHLKPISAATQAALDYTVKLTGDQSITGNKNFSTGILAGAAQLANLSVSPVGDHGYISFRSRSATPTVRTAYVGVAAAGSTTFSITNEMTDGSIILNPNGWGGVILNGVGVLVSGSLYVEGIISGSGESITNLDGSNISMGTVADARLSSNVATLAGTQTFSGIKSFTQDVNIIGGALNFNTPSAPGGWARGLTFRSADGATIFGGSGAYGNATSLNAVYLSAGTTPWNGNLGLSISAAGAATFSHSVAAASFSGSGASLTALNGTNISTGTVSDARLSTNQATLGGVQTFTGAKTFTGAVVVPSPTADTHAAHKKYVDDSITALINTSPATLDTLNELAAAIGNDPNFATTMTNQIATKVPLTGNSTITGATILKRDVSGGTSASATLQIQNSNTSGVPSIYFHTPTVADGILSLAASGEFQLRDSSNTSYKNLRAAALYDNSNRVYSASNAPTIAAVTGLQAALDAKQPTIAAGTTAQYYRGDKTWQALNASAVGLGNVANVAQVAISGNQTITGVKTFTSGIISASVMVTGLGIKPSADHGYISFYSRDAAPSTRTAFVGVGSAGSTTFGIYNEMTNGSILVQANGTGTITLAGAGVGVSGSLNVTGTITGPGSGITALNASNLASGTVPQARMVPNVQRVVFTTAGTARPAGATYVEWMGPVQPTNMAANDTWINTGA